MKETGLSAKHETIMYRLVMRNRGKVFIIEFLCPYLGPERALQERPRTAIKAPDRNKGPRPQ